VQLQPEALSRPSRAGATPLAVVSNTELRERFAIRRAALAGSRSPAEYPAARSLLTEMSLMALSLPLL
jgi:hypothetical protein